MNPSQAVWMPVAQIISANRAYFSKGQETNNEYLIDKEFADSERKLFKDKLTKK